MGHGSRGDPEESVDVDESRVRGQRVYRYWTTPTAGGQQVIPAIEIRSA